MFSAVICGLISLKISAITILYMFLCLSFLSYLQPEQHKLNILSPQKIIWST
jgi:hypothetical protein